MKSENCVELTEFLNAPGVRQWSQIAPVLAGLGWVWLTALLWRGGFTDLVERLRGEGPVGSGRAHALVMLPLRAVMLSLAAAFGAGATMFGIWVQGAVLLTVIDAVRSAG